LVVRFPPTWFLAVRDAWVFHVLVTDKRTFASLDLTRQKVIREAAAMAAVGQHEISTEDQATALALLKEKMQFDPLPSRTRAALRRVTASVADDVANWVGADVVNKVLVARATPAAGRVIVSDKGKAFVGKDSQRSPKAD
jgi:TRAP-type C4-dicarboxylate transport system substrate-binding protein